MGDQARLADALRNARLQALLMAQRDELPVAATLALQVSLEVGRVMARLGASWRSLDIDASKLARCLKAENVKLGSVEEVATALGCDAVICFVPRWPTAPTSRSTPLSDVAALSHPADTQTGAKEKGR